MRTTRFVQVVAFPTIEVIGRPQDDETGEYPMVSIRPEGGELFTDMYVDEARALKKALKKAIRAAEQ